MADERSCVRSRDVDRHETELREVREKYVLKELYLAAVTSLHERVKALEDEATSIRRGNRVAMLGAVGAVAAAVVLQFFQRGSGH